jgi:hypothetical protein
MVSCATNIENLEFEKQFSTQKQFEDRTNNLDEAIKLVIEKITNIDENEKRQKKAIEQRLQQLQGVYKTLEVMDLVSSSAGETLRHSVAYLVSLRGKLFNRENENYLPLLHQLNVAN